MQEERGKCQESCEELLARLKAEASQHAETKERLAQAESDAAGQEVELQRLQEENCGFQERCQLAEVRLASLKEEAVSQAELQLDRAVLQQQLAKAEAERSGMLRQLLDLHEEKGMHKERIRELERQLGKAKQRETHHAGALLAMAWHSVKWPPAARGQILLSSRGTALWMMTALPLRS